MLSQMCEICCDPFEQFYDDDEEEWHLRDAMRVDDRVYHPACYEDYKEVGACLQSFALSFKACQFYKIQFYPQSEVGSKLYANLCNRSLKHSDFGCPTFVGAIIGVTCVCMCVCVSTAIGAHRSGARGRRVDARRPQAL